MICFSLLGGWCIKGIIKNPTPTPKYRKKRKQTVKLSVKRQTNGEFIDCVIYRKEFLPSIMFAAVYTHSISSVLSPACFSLVLFLPPPPSRLSSLSPLLFPFLALFLPPSGLPCHSSPLLILFPPLSLFLRPSLPPSFFLSFSNSFSKHVTSYSQLCSLCVNSLSRSPIWVMILILCCTMSSFSTNKAFHFP